MTEMASHPHDRDHALDLTPQFIPLLYVTARQSPRSPKSADGRRPASADVCDRACRCLISGVLVLGHVFVANMTGNVIFLGFWFVPHSGVDLTAALVAFGGFVFGTVIGGRFARHLDEQDSNSGWFVGARDGGGRAGGVVDPGRHLGARLPGQHQADSDRRARDHIRSAERHRAPVRHSGTFSTTVLTSYHRRDRVRQQTGGRNRSPGKAALLVSCSPSASGAVVGATMSLFTVAPVIALAAAVVAASALIFRFGPRAGFCAGLVYGRCHHLATGAAAGDRQADRRASGVRRPACIAEPSAA